MQPLKKRQKLLLAYITELEKDLGKYATAEFIHSAFYFDLNFIELAKKNKNRKGEKVK
jgi:hypothetical protein